MTLSPSLKLSSQRIQSPHKNSKSPKNKKIKKSKKNLIESLQNPTDSTQEQSSPVPIAPSPRKRTKSPGVRVVGGRIYDSENGKTCHQCRQKTMDFVAACKGLKRDKPCTIKFCHKCLLNRYGEKAEEVDRLEDWKCPKCREMCNCSFCMKKRGHQPTGILFHTAKATGFKSVSEMLTVNGPETCLALKKEARSDESPTSPGEGEGKKMKKLKRKKPEKSKTDECVGEGNNGNENQSLETHLSGDTNLDATTNGEEAINGTVDGVGKKLKKKQKKAKKLEGVTSNDEAHDGNNDEGLQSGNENDNVDPKKPKKSRKKTHVDPLKTDENAGNDGVEDKSKPKKSRKKIPSDPLKTDENAGNDGVEDKPKPKKSRKKIPSDPLKTDENAGNDGVEDKPKPKKSRKKTPLDPLKTDDNAGNDGLEDQPKPKKSRKKIPLDPLKTDDNAGNDDLDDKSKPPAKSGPKIKPEKKSVSKFKVDADADLALPQGTDLKTVADVELSAVDVGPALQFLEFCSAFGEILQLKKGEPESILKEATSGCTLRRRQYSPLVRFHTQLLAMIQKDVDEDCPSSPISNGSSWFQELGKHISSSRYSSKEFTPQLFNRGNSGYEDLDSSKKLKLLNFLCDEALCTKDSRAWIEEQNEKLVQKGKEAKEKVVAAKEKEKHLKQQMQDEVAKAILEKNGGPLSISEHEDLVSKIKTDAAKAHAERLEALGMVPKIEQRSDAVRTEPVLLNEDGLILWKLQSCSDEPKILLQDISNRDSDKAEDKWFLYNIEQKEAVEKYISSKRRKRLRSQVKTPVDTCLDKENIQEE